MVTALIETVELCSDRKIKVSFKFKDEYEELVNYLDTLGTEVKYNVQE